MWALSSLAMGFIYLCHSGGAGCWGSPQLPPEELFPLIQETTPQGLKVMYPYSMRSAGLWWCFQDACTRPALLFSALAGVILICVPPLSPTYAQVYLHPSHLPPDLHPCTLTLSDHWAPPSSRRRTPGPRGGHRYFASVTKAEEVLPGELWGVEGPSGATSSSIPPSSSRTQTQLELNISSMDSGCSLQQQMGAVLAQPSNAYLPVFLWTAWSGSHRLELSDKCL
ncbi:hypothetical protein DPEC_G00292150 [Dallia pectoralis]|uniref:Uncharacterized protein n=1 Tax=Dallia pectoralis TaxID=75939 RepID=A0ACC2FHZ1_DALPE|nr:hypothetical protein DPEC_G00292150 [Dallia pectoralis]